MNPYNGYTGKEREAKLRAQHARVKRGFPAHPPGPCSICQDPTAPVEAHAEDYSLPYLWEPPAEYALCRLCHRDRLHKRFLKPDIWAAHKAHVRRGGYSSDVRRPEIVRELDAFRKAWRNGETLELRQLRPRIVPADAWWERLTTDPSSLTSAASRPRP